MTLQTGRPAPAELADAEVLDQDGSASRLGARWDDRPAVLVFLRHFACVACSEHVTMLMPRLGELSDLGVGVTFVGNGEPRYVAGFVERNQIVPELAEVVTDPSLRAFAAAGLVRGFWQTYGPRGLAHFVRAFVGGNRQSTIEGDNLQQGGVVMIAGDGTVAYAHADAVLGDHADSNDVVDAALRLAALGAAVA